MTHPADPRKPLTRKQYAMLALRQEGRCGCGCGRKLDFVTPGAITDEHILGLFAGGSNDLDNRALYVTDPCAKAKTAGEAKGNQKLRDVIAKEHDHKLRMEGVEPPVRKKKRPLKSGGFQKKPEGYKYQWSRK